MSWVKDSADVVASVWHALVNFVSTHSVWISAFTNGVILVLREFHVIALTEGQENSVTGLVLLLTTIFVSKTNVASTRVDDIKEKARDEGKETGIAMASPATRGAGDGTMPPAA